MRVLDRF